MPCRRTNRPRLIHRNVPCCQEHEDEYLYVLRTPCSIVEYVLRRVVINTTCRSTNSGMTDHPRARPSRKPAPHSRPASWSYLPWPRYACCLSTYPYTQVNAGGREAPRTCCVARVIASMSTCTCRQNICLAEGELRTIDAGCATCSLTCQSSRGRSLIRASISFLMPLARLSPATATSSLPPVVPCTQSIRRDPPHTRPTWTPSSRRGSSVACPCARRLLWACFWCVHAPLQHILPHPPAHLHRPFASLGPTCIRPISQLHIGQWLASSPSDPLPTTLCQPTALEEDSALARTTKPGAVTVLQAPTPLARSDRPWAARFLSLSPSLGLSRYHWWRGPAVLSFLRDHPSRIRFSLAPGRGIAG